MKIRCFGALRIQDQLPRIIEGFKELGHEIVDENSSPYDCDLLYINDPAHADEAESWVKPKINSNLPRLISILNIQDIPYHIPDFSAEKLGYQLSRFTKITTISKTTQKDVKELTGFDSTIIYQPAQPIFQTNEKKYNGFKYLIAGRVNDPNKRTKLFYDYLEEYGNPMDFVIVLGSEDPGFGDWQGVVSNEDLNNWYNSVDYVFCLTKYGGIELSQIEAILAGKFPIVCNDSDVAMEFNPEFACDPSPEGIHKKIIEIEANQAKYKQIVIEKQKDFKVKFSKIEVARKILELVK